MHRPRITRRAALKAVGGLAASAFAGVEALSWIPERAEADVPPRLPDIQHNIGPYLAPARSIDGVSFRFGPVHTLFVTLGLQRAPRRHDRQVLGAALAEIEDAYPFAPQGLFCLIAYGLPYFRRLPGGLHGPLVRNAIPRLRGIPGRLALEEAVPGPTDVGGSGHVVKRRFNVPVRIEHNDVLVTLRSDSLSHVRDVAGWLFDGSNRLRGRHVPSPDLGGLLVVTSSRPMFLQPGLPHRLAKAKGLPYASHINPTSPMWMGFSDMQESGSGPARITTFAGNRSARLTTARRGDYFDNGAVQVLSHVILDLEQFYAKDEPYTERVQYMFRSDPIPSTGYADQYARGGGPAYLPNEFKGPGDALRNARGEGTYAGARRMGHLTALQRSSRAPDGTPLHLRMDGPGFDAMDVPGHGDQPKLHFTAFVPTAASFRRMRRDQAALDLVEKHGVDHEDNGLERFLTATRRQNFLVPPRRHRAFPLVERTD